MCPILSVKATERRHHDQQMTFGLKFPYQNMQIHLTDNITETNRVDRGYIFVEKGFYTQKRVVIRVGYWSIMKHSLFS